VGDGRVVARLDAAEGEGHASSIPAENVYQVCTSEGAPVRGAPQGSPATLDQLAAEVARSV
jgi:hypothetical protein